MHTSSESMESTLMARRAHFRTTWNQGAYAAVGLQWERASSSLALAS